MIIVNPAALTKKEWSSIKKKYGDINRKVLIFLSLIFTCTISYAQYEIWETQLDVDNYTHLDRIFFLDENYGWAIGGNTIGSAGPYFFTIDGGENWYVDPNSWPDNHSGTDIVFISQNTGFIAGANGIIYKTTDGGQSWVPIQTPATQNVIKLFFVDENNGWATLGQYSEGNILHSFDGGNSWGLNRVFHDCYGNTSSIFFTDENSGWVAGCAYNTENDYVAIKKTTNSGGGWETLDSLNNLSNYYMDIYFSDSSNGWIVGSYYSYNLIMHTVDGGATWEGQEVEEITKTQEPGQVNCVYFVDDTTGWIGTSVAEGGAIYFTSNGGQNWHFQQEFPQAIYDIQMINHDTGWAVGRDFVYHTNNGSFVTNVIENHVEKEPFIILPNPVTNAFRIGTSSDFFCENCQLEITNITGNSILQFNNISFEAITQNPIDLSNYPTGVYFVVIRYESNSQIINYSQKIIKL